MASSLPPGAQVPGTLHPNPEQRIAQLESELAALRTEVQGFTATVSHDLRASLRHIVSYAQLVQEDAAPLLSHEVQGFLNTITDAARHMGVLMDGLAELSRVGSAPVRLEPVPLQSLVQEVCAQCAAHHPARSITWHIATDLPMVHADAALLRLVLQQVLDNATKFTAGTDAQIAVSCHNDAAPGTVCLVVADNGAGFNPALQANLFQPLQRLHTAKQFPGIGMGLALVRKALQRMGGAVAAQGQVGQGCTVHLTLPAA